MSLSSFLPRLARVRPRLAFLLGLLLVVAATTLPFVTHGAVTVQTVSGEAALEAKADKLLRHVYHVTTQSEPENANEPTHADAVQELDKLSRLTRVSRNADETLRVGVIVQLNSSDGEELKAAGFAVGAVVGDIATVETDANRLPELASLTSIKRMWANVRRHPLNDRARQGAGIDNASGQRVVSQTGAGVVVATIDTGIDFRHADFTVPGSNGTRTRIKYLLDMTAYNGSTTGWDYSLPGSTAKIGKLYTESDINAALAVPKPADQNSDIVKERDKAGHGTHVAGTAAGNGIGAPSAPNVYAGMAPAADLIVVKASRENDGTDGFQTDDEINAMQFIQTKAAELGEPFVVNMSLGGQAGSHDGTGPDEMAIDNIVNSGAGRAFCIAAGNEGANVTNGGGIHAAGTVPSGGSYTLHFNANSNPNFIDLYSSPHGTSSSGRYSVSITEPGSTQPIILNFNANGFAQQNGQFSDSSVQIWDALDNKETSDTSDDQADIFLNFNTGAKTGTWTITLTNGSGEPASTFDAWSDGDNVNFTEYDNTTHLVGSPGTARGAITVGAYVARSSSQTIGNYAYFTSPGPTADGRQKPDISADGYYLYSSRSSDTSDTSIFTYGTVSNALASGVSQSLYGGLAGTSMATPVVTGSVALLLQANRNLTASQIKTYLAQGATHDSFTGAGWESHFGNGKLNVPATLNTIFGQAAQPTIQFSTATFDTSEDDTENTPRATITVTRTGDTSGASSVSYRTVDDPSPVRCDVINGTAYARCDYITTVGTLTFNAGETSKTFAVPIIDDSFVEGTESFSVQLLNPAGATLGGQATAAVRISDNDSFQTANPIFGTTFFVRQQYLDFLSREPEAGEPWSATLNNCAAGDTSCDRISVSANFFRSQEFQLKGLFVYRFYKLAFNRQPLYSEIVVDMASVTGSTTAELQAKKGAFTTAFAQRQEFNTLYGAMTNQQFIDTLMNRYSLQSITTPDPANPDGTVKVTLTRTDLVNQLNQQSLTRAQVVRAIADSDQVGAAEFNPAFVAMQYFGYLRRDPDAQGYADWLRTINANPADFRSMVNGFMNSTEYRLRFGQP
jgi:subtilisin family serine protease